MGTAQSRQYQAIKGGDNKLRSIDPGGSFFNGTTEIESNAPTVSLFGNADRLISHEVIATFTFTSDYPGHWTVIAAPTGTTLSIGSDRKSATLVWSVPAQSAFPSQSVYIGAACRNSAGEDYKFIRAHVGLNGYFTVGAGKDYADLQTAIAAWKAFANPVGWAAVVSDGTYTNSSNLNMFIRTNQGSASQPNHPPSGAFTPFTDGNGNSRYTVQTYNTVMAESPFGMIMDCENTRYHGLQIIGTEDVDAYELSIGFGTGNKLTASGAENTKAVKFMGIVSKNALGSGITIENCSNNYIQYCASFESGIADTSTQKGSSNISTNHSRRIIFENCATWGEGRYQCTGWRAKEITFRGIIMRTDVRSGTYPMGGFSFYSCRDMYGLNALHIDSNQNDYWLANSSEVIGSFSAPSTGYEGYPDHLHFERCLSMFSALPTSSQDGYDIDDNDTSNVYIDVGSWHLDVDERAVGTCIARDGPSVFTRLTINRCSNLDSTAGFGNTRTKQTINKSIINDFGRLANGSSTSSGYLVSTASSVLTTTLDDNILYGRPTDVAEEFHSGSNGLVKINNIENLDPKTLGMRVPGWISPSSYLGLNGYGQTNFYYQKGYSSNGFGDTDVVTATTEAWIPKMCWQILRPLMKNYVSGVVTKRSGGTGTLSGNRGCAQDGFEILDNYITAQNNLDAPMPIDFTLSSTGTEFVATLQLPSSNYISDCTQVNLYLNGNLAETFDSASHAITLPELIDGKTYEVQFSFVSQTLGESEKSPPQTIVIG